MNSVALGGITKRIYPNFNIGIFENRLKLQKIIYLLQAWGINLNYNFSLYIYGPYCTELTKTAFLIEDINLIKEVGFEDIIVENKFKDFLEEITPFKDDIEWLEIASTIHLFTKLYPNKEKNDLITEIKKIKHNFAFDIINNVWEDLKKWQLVN